MKTVSIIIPCFNAERYIEQCLDSIIAQNYANLEIICVNDGSQDDTLPILKEYQKKYGNIRIQTQRNRGISQARNAGLDIATGEFIMFVDADDWLEENCLKVVLTGYQNADITCFSYYRDFESGSVRKDFGIEGDYGSEFIQQRIIGLVGEELKNISSFDALIPCWGKIYRRETISCVRFKSLKDIGTWEDGLFNVEVLENAENVRIINKPFYHYRKLIKSTYTTNYKENLYQKWKVKFEWLQSFIRLNNKPYIFQEALYNRICITTLNLAFNEMNANSTFLQKKCNLNVVLHDKIYIEAFSHLELNTIPALWRGFYYFAKARNAVMVTLLADVIYRYINRKNS